MKAILLAGGLGTRLRPLTNETPKPLLPIKGKPIIEHTMLNLKKHGITEIILSIGYKAEKIQEYFGNGEKLGVEIEYCIEDEPLGTGGAIKMATENIKGPFVLLWGDNLSDVNVTQMIDFHKERSAKLTMLLTQREDTENWGCAVLDGEHIVSFVEKPKREEAPSTWINAGVFIVDPSAIVMLPDGKSSFEHECLEKLCGAEGSVFAFLHKGQWFPTDNLDKYNKANEEFNPSTP